MSRCFPFPPPGYEKEARTVDIDLLKQEKHRKKRHQKHKKDKEKRDGKEKREKDRSDGNHRRKEKHQDKKKEKEKEKDQDKDKSSTTEENKIACQSEIYDGQKLCEKERELVKDRSSISNKKKKGYDEVEKPIQNNLLSRPLGNNTERGMEEREGDKKQGDNRKDKDKEKKSHGKDKEMEKEKVKEKSEHKSKEQDKLDRNKNDLLGTLNVRTLHVSMDGDRNTAKERNPKKRKDIETNGFLHETDIRPSKMPRTGSHASTENRKKLEPCQTLVLSTSYKLGPPNNLKERKVNGVIEPWSLSISSKNSSATTRADQITKASVKPPHPDSKYLSQVLSVPKMDKWCDFDDQEWLFSSKDRSSEKPDVGSTEMPMVWDESRQIESADLYALPYVIPY